MELNKINDVGVGWGAKVRTSDPRNADTRFREMSSRENRSLFQKQQMGGAQAREEKEPLPQTHSLGVIWEKK